MIPVAERSIEHIGTIQAWESETTYPEETPFVSDVGWARGHTTQRSPAWLGWNVVTDPTPLVAPLHVHTFSDQMGRLWMPWAFSPSDNPDIAVSSVGTGVMASGIVLAIGGSGGLIGTTVLPAGGVLRLMNPGQIMVETTRRWEEADEIRLVAPGLLPRTLRVRETPDVLPTLTDPRAAEALDAITDVQRWLNMSVSEVAEMCRFSLRSARYWASRQTSSPRPSTVRHLYDVHSFLSSLVRSMGRQGARDWLARPSEGGPRRIDVLGRDNGVARLLREAGDVLFAEAPAVERPVPEPSFTADAETEAEPYVPAEHHAPPRRPRRAPQRGE